MNIPNFSEELSQASKASEQQLYMWLQLDVKYHHGFLQSQQSVYQLIFGRDGQDGALCNIYRRLQANNDKSKFLDDFTLLYQFIQQLTPRTIETQNNFYDLLMHDNLYQSSISIRLLPPHLQLLLSDQSISQYNPHLCAFLEIFHDNIKPTMQVVPSQSQNWVSGKQSTSSVMKKSLVGHRQIVTQSYAYELKLNTPLAMWVYLLNSLRQYKDPLQSSDLFSTMQSGVQLPLYDSSFTSMIQNPVIAIMRRILSNLCVQIESSSVLVDGKPNAEKPQNLINLLQKMIVLTQEFTLYGCLFQINPNELKLSAVQAQHFHRLRILPYLIDSQLQSMFLLMVLNCQYGQKVDQLFQQYFHIYNVSNRQSLSPPQVVTFKQFFLSCGRPSAHITFAQALYRLLSFSIQNYPQDRQCSTLRLTNLISIWVLFARWPQAQNEQQFLGCAEVFDLIMANFTEKIIKSQRQIDLAFNTTQRMNIFEQILNAYHSTFWKTVKKFHKINYIYKIQLLKSIKIDTKTITPKLMDQKRKDLSNPFHYHSLELRDRFKEFCNQVQHFFPFYTLLLNQLFVMLGRLPRLNMEEASALVNIISFVACVDPMVTQEERNRILGAQLYGGALYLKERDGYREQFPSLQELKSFCENLESPSDPHYAPMAPLYQVFGNIAIRDSVSKVIENLYLVWGENTKKDFIKSESQLIKAQNTRYIPETIYSLEAIYGVEVEKETLLQKQSKTIKISPSRISTPQIQIQNEWLVPPRDNEIMLLFILMKQLSFAFDTVLNRKPLILEGRIKKQIVPITQWPRIFACVENLQIMGVLGVLIYILWYILSFIVNIIQ